MPTIRTYVVVHDFGVAPNVDGSVCTLCLCKPRIRSASEVGDWVVGLWPVPHRYRVTYAMRVGRKLPIDQYYRCGEFDDKKPDRSRTPDNIYRRGSEGGWRRREDTRVHEPPYDSWHDIKGKYSLIADRFWYFGGTPRELPQHLRWLDLGDNRRGHRLKRVSDEQLETLVAWLESSGHGVLGTPRDGRARPPDETGSQHTSGGPSLTGGESVTAAEPQHCREDGDTSARGCSDPTAGKAHVRICAAR